MTENEISYKVIGAAIDIHKSIGPVHYAQSLTYLKLSGLKLGLLINFNSRTLKNSIHRVANKL